MNNYFCSKQVIHLVLLAGSMMMLTSSNLLAQSKPTNPLEVEVNKSDPVIPLGYNKRQLSTFEINRIKREMARLDPAAKQELQRGQVNTAFELWYRYLRLARAAGIETEIAVLGEVGEIAWQANRGEDLRNIANRLITIKSEIEIESASEELLQQLATAYQQVRYSEQAIAIYEKILLNNKTEGNAVEVESTLQILGKLYLGRFNYGEAAATYEELLVLARSKSPLESKADVYLEILANIYDRTAQTKQAIATKQNLVQSYTAAPQTAKLARLELNLAKDYKTLKLIRKAVLAYESAFTIALAEQYLAIADDALTGLSELYQQEQESQKAIATFELLLDVQRQSYNYYGLVNTYDNLGKIYLKLDRTKEAQQSFQQALELAQDLNYKVGYFSRKVNQGDRLE